MGHAQGELKWPVGCMRREDSVEFEKGSLAGVDYYLLQVTGVMLSMVITLFFMSFASANRYGDDADVLARSVSIKHARALSIRYRDADVAAA